MATRFPCTRNLSASQITMGVLPVPPTLKLPILMTAAFSRFCLSQPFRYIRTRASTPAPYSKESGQRRSEEHTSELQSRSDLVCRLLLEKKNTKHTLRT